MAFRTTRLVWEQMLRWAKDRPEMEVTGFVYGTPGDPLSHVVQPMTNVHPRPNQNYSWSPAEAQSHLDRLMGDEGVVAIYHSHPTQDPAPSETDQEAALWVGAYYLIVTPDGRGAAYYCPEMRLLIKEEVELV